MFKFFIPFLSWILILSLSGISYGRQNYCYPFEMDKDIEIFFSSGMLFFNNSLGSGDPGQPQDIVFEDGFYMELGVGFFLTRYFELELLLGYRPTSTSYGPSVTIINVIHGITYYPIPIEKMQLSPFVNLGLGYKAYRNEEFPEYNIKSDLKMDLAYGGGIGIKFLWTDDLSADLFIRYYLSRYAGHPISFERSSLQNDVNLNLGISYFF